MIRHLMESADRHLEARRREPDLDVVVLAPWLGGHLAGGNHPGGAEIQVLLLVRSLAERGYRTGLLVPGADGLSLPRQMAGVAIIPLEPWHPRRILLPGIGYAAWIFTLQRRIGAAAAHTYVQRVGGADTGLVALAAKLRGRRFVYAAANLLDFWPAELEPRRAYRGLMRLGVRLADEVVVQSEEQATLCRTRFGREPTVIGSFAEAAPEALPHRDAFLWVGRLAPYKRPERLLALARELPDARFVLVGGPDIVDGGATADCIRREASALPNVTMLGPCPRDRVFELMRSAVAVVNTSDWEGMPNVFLEGWARGVPALTLAQDPDGVIAREGLGGHAGGSPERFVELARELWQKRERLGAMSTRCRNYVARAHSPQAVLARWERVLGPPSR